MRSVRETFNPEVVVMQCGADGLAGDPMSSFNLTLTSYRFCLYLLLKWKLPLLLIGGGTSLDDGSMKVAIIFSIVACKFYVL
jgi:acetoin utilization deacetylase AcuC-like enzyme